MDDLKQLLADWIRSARKAAELSQEQLGAKLALELSEERGYTKANISGWENCKHSPSTRQLVAVAKVTGYSLPQPIIDAMQPGGAPSEISPVGVLQVHGALPVRVVDDSDTVPIRFIRLRLRAGLTGFATEPDLEEPGVFNMQRDALARLNVSPQGLLVARVRGRSMEPMFFEDDEVIINTADRKLISREIYALNFNGEACIKQLLNKAGQWYLHSLNPDFGPINVRSGQCDIVGRVVYQPGRVVTGRL